MEDGDHLDAAEPLSIEQELVLADVDLELHQVIRAADEILEDIETEHGVEVAWIDRAMLHNCLRWAYTIGKGLADPDEDLTNQESSDTLSP